MRALSDSVYSTAAPLDRRLLLSMLAGLPPGAGVDKNTASAALIWRRPRWAKRLQPEPVADLLNEAHQLGLVGRGAISTPGRALHAAGDAGVRRRDGPRTAQADRPLPGAGRPDRRGARAAGTRTGRATGHGGHRRVRRRRNGVPGQRTVDQARAGHRQDRRRIARSVHRALQNPCAAGADLPDRRRRAPARATADRHGRVVRAVRRSRAAGPGGGAPAAAGPAAAGAGADGGDIAGADHRSAGRPAGRRDSRRPPRMPPAPSSTSAPAARGCPPAAAPPPAPADTAPEQRDPERGGRGVTQSDRRAVRQCPDRPGGRDVAAAARRAAGTRC